MKFIVVHYKAEDAAQTWRDRRPLAELPDRLPGALAALLCDQRAWAPLGVQGGGGGAAWEPVPAHSLWRLR